MSKLSLSALCGALLLSAGCVAVPVGPQAGGPAPTTPSAGSLAGSVAGQAFVNPQTGQALNLWSDGTYTVSTGNQQSFGTWRTVEPSVQMCFTGPVAAYANGACIPVRYDGDFLTLFNASRSQAMEAWAVQ
ncbi:hypothetical protein Jann_0348 [Jannaschia sp. CCS1]|nr:hypothetical protein Jann_0348 [Jannaschia sp. CCS1]